MELFSSYFIKGSDFMSNYISLQDFLNKPPETVKVFDKGRSEQLTLVLTDSDRYITTKNMGTSSRKVYHYWTLENAYFSLVN